VPTTPEPARASTARILTAAGTVAGMGLLVGGRQIITCAHVINTALGRDQRIREQPDAEVHVDFPLLGDGAVVPARVLRWLPPPTVGVVGADLALLELTAAPPAAVVPALLAGTPPATRAAVEVYGFARASRTAPGGWVAAVLRGEVAPGLFQLDSEPGTALDVKPGYSGGGVWHPESGTVIGLVSAVSAGGKDSYAVSAARLLADLPELHGRTEPGPVGRRAPDGSLTVLHLSDLRLGAGTVFGGTADENRESLYQRLHLDLENLETAHGLRPELVVLTGDSTDGATTREFRELEKFLTALAGVTGLPRQRIVVVPGNHDVNHLRCRSYFLECETEDTTPVAPYWPKWINFAKAFGRFYGGVAAFVPDEPWTLFEMPELATVVAGLNSTLLETHRDADRVGWIGADQLGWFAERLARYRDQGWLRIGAVHHNVVGGAAVPGENLRDADELDRQLGETGLLNLLLHGHTHAPDPHRLGSGLLTLATGSAAVPVGAIGYEVPNRYQLLTVTATGVTRHAREYSTTDRRWSGNTRIDPGGSSWQVHLPATLSDVRAAFTERPAEAARAGGEPEPGDRDGADDDRSSGDTFLDRVREVIEVSLPAATITPRREGEFAYLRVSNPLPGGGAEQWPVGVIDQDVSSSTVAAFAAAVHGRFAVADPSVKTELVYAGTPAGPALVAEARERGIRLRSFMEFQGLLDLRPLAETQATRLAGDRVYPSSLYVPQRYRVLDRDAAPGPSRDGLLTQVINWLGASEARFVMLLGDFGRGKTFLLRELARQLPYELPGVVPVLVELRGLEKAPSLDELLVQHLIRNKVESLELSKLRYMVRSGRLALLLDGYDELAARVSYENAADYLRTLLDAVTDQAKIVLTSRSQHFRSTPQVLSELGQWVSTLGASRVVVLEEFDHDQIRAFLEKSFGDPERAAARYELLSGIGDLLDLAQNPRMLSFLASLEEPRLRAVLDRRRGEVSAADLYQSLVEFWLGEEAKRQQDYRVPGLAATELLAACEALALRLWRTSAAEIPAKDLAAEVATVLQRLAERSFSTDQAAHAIGVRSLLVRTEEDGFRFVHQSVMEWLVARAAADDFNAGHPRRLLDGAELSPPMAAFLCDLAGHDRVRSWAHETLGANAPETLHRNALVLIRRLEPDVPADGPAPPPAQLAGTDLRGQDLANRDLRRANLSRADLRGARLVGTNLAGADLTGADLRGARLVRSSLVGARLERSNWSYAALLGTGGLPDPVGPELTGAAVAGRDPAEPIIAPRAGFGRCIAISPDSQLVAYGQRDAVVLAELATGQPLRVLTGHTDTVSGVVFSGAGDKIASSSYDQTARVWATATGAPLATLTGHTGRLYGVAFSADGRQVATASHDRTARIWDAGTGAELTALTGHRRLVYGVAFAPDGKSIATGCFDGVARLWDIEGRTATELIGHGDEVYGVAFSERDPFLASASLDRTARIWRTDTGELHKVLAGPTGHTDGVSGVAFSADGTLLATSSRDRTARVWETATGTCRTVLTGHAGGVSRVAFAPSGAVLATASRDRTARIWDVETGAPRGTLRGQRSVDSGLALHGRLVATPLDRTVRLWDAHTGRPRRQLGGPQTPDRPPAELVGHRDAVLAVAFSTSGRLVAAGSRDRTARIWEVNRGRTRTVLRGHDGQVVGVAFAADGRHVATASSDRTAKIWEVATGLCRRTLTGHQNPVSAVAYAPDGRTLVTASLDRTVRIWDAATGATLHTLRGHDDEVNAVAFSRDGLLATAAADNTARIWDTASGERLATLTGHTRTVTDVVFTPDGRLLTASADNTARLWSSDGGLIRTLAGHTSRLSGIAVASGGRLAVTAANDGTTRLWDLETGECHATVLLLPDGGSAVLLPNGDYKLEGDPGGVLWWAIKLCRFAPGELDEYDGQIRLLDPDAKIWPPSRA
jgi:WD40 repeat protein/3',5'-cyclic AMP phosphodiesterase CpdA